MGFFRRFTSFPSLETLREIEAVNVVDLAPPGAAVGVGTGAVLVVGEFEDGPFAAGGDAAAYDPERRGVLEATSPGDLRDKYGGFGFARTGNPHADPCARYGGGELWNGSGFLKLLYLRAQRLMVARVDASVGEVSMTPLACVDGTERGPFTSLLAGAWLSVDPAGGGATPADAIAAAVASVTAGTTIAVSSGPLAGDEVLVTVDGSAPVRVTFPTAAATIAAVVSRINAVIGATVASDSGGALQLDGLQAGSGGAIAIEEVVAGSMTRLGFSSTSASASGTGNVADVSAVTVAELAAIINGTAALASADVSARVAPNGGLRVCAPTSVQISGSAATTLGLSTALVNDGDHDGGTIPAGTRVEDGATVWVTCQTLTVDAGATDPVLVRVRPATDDGSAVGASAGTVDTLTDQPDFADFSVTNPTAVAQALSDAAKDAAYRAAMEATLAADRNPATEADYLLSARRTAATVLDGADNARRASERMTGRKFVTRAPLGASRDTAIADVAANRSERVFYCYPGFRVRVPQIAAVGTAGGLGFTADGVITVGADGPLTTICARLNPEENPAQQTDLIAQFFALEDYPGARFTIDDYIAFKAAGICAPIIGEEGPGFQSGVTSSLTSGRTTIARRKMADFLQDSLARLAKPYQKKLQTEARYRRLLGVFEGFMGGLIPPGNEDAQRIDSYVIDGDSANTPELIAAGVRVIRVVARTLSSFDAIVIQTEIGENAITVSEI